MKKCNLFFVMLSMNISFAQQRDSLPDPALMIGDRLEYLTENNGDIEIEDDYYLQQMKHFIHDPVNLNTATENELSQLQLLTPLHIQSLISYRTLFGHFIDLYELQAIPGWSISLIERIRSYVTIALPAIPISFRDLFKKGHASLLITGSQVLEKSKGYIADTSGANYFVGSPLKILVRFKYAFRNGLQYGLTFTKNAGEQLFKGAEKQGFDFSSPHLFLRNLGIIKALAIGDYAINFGQGLIQWQSGLAAKKGSDVVNIKRQEDVLRPYNSPGKVNFHRGIGITLQKKLMEATAFVSYRDIDANLIFDSISKIAYVTSLQTSGYHRTQSELKNKNSQGQFTLGGNIQYNHKQWHVGLNGVHYHFKWPIIKKAELYNKFSLSGNKWSNYSADYSYTLQNVHFFGEVAMDEHTNLAFMNGLLISLNAQVDMSVVYRSISRPYQSLYSNAFTENNSPNNEHGLFAGIKIIPIPGIKMEAYFDLYHFPWLKYRTDAPTYGNDFLVKLSYTPNKQVELSTRYHTERKALNYNPDAEPLNPVPLHTRQSWRTEFSDKLSHAVSMRTRVEVSWYDSRMADGETGFLLYTDISFKPGIGHMKGTAGFQYFETDGYNSRFYTFHHDISTGFSTPLSYGKGTVYYCNLTYNISKQGLIGLRLSRSHYPEKTSLGTGLDQIMGNKKTDIKLVAQVNF